MLVTVELTIHRFIHSSLSIDACLTSPPDGLGDTAPLVCVLNKR